MRRICLLAFLAALVAIMWQAGKQNAVVGKKFHPGWWRSGDPYPIPLSLRYRLVGQQQPQASITGITTNISSQQVAFRAESSPPIGATIELFIDWPVSLEGVPLQLVVEGQVVRNEEEQTVVQIERHAFRTRKSET